MVSRVFLGKYSLCEISMFMYAHENNKFTLKEYFLSKFLFIFHSISWRLDETNNFSSVYSIYSSSFSPCVFFHFATLQSRRKITWLGYKLATLIFSFYNMHMTLHQNILSHILYSIAFTRNFIKIQFWKEMILSQKFFL